MPGKGQPKGQNVSPDAREGRNTGPVSESRNKNAGHSGANVAVDSASIENNGVIEAQERHIDSDVEDQQGHDHRADEGEGTPETLYAQMLEADKSRKQRKLMKPGGQVVYLGETFNLTYLLHQNAPGGDQIEERRPLHYKLPVGVADSGDMSSQDGLLRQQNAFDIPSSGVCHELYKTYFTHVAPHYPVIDRELFGLQYVNPQHPASWLLLQAVLFMAAGHCDETILKDGGFNSRYDARLTFYKRAKALYDADHEKDKVTLVQAVFLMSFWWASPVDSKDTWHWLGIAISLGLTIGMHRSTKDSGMPLKDQRLWKRIWWSLFAEDKHAAAALGRPVHIRLSDCDVEQLESSDFEGQPYGLDQTLHVSLPEVEMAYPISLASLSHIVEQIIEKSSQSSNQQNNSLELCESMLQAWEAGLLDILRLNNPDSRDTIWPSMLHIAVCWFRILAHRTRTPGYPSTPSKHDAHQKAMTAANQMVRIMEELLASGLVQYCPIHVIPALFAAMSMLATDIRSGNKISQQLAYMKIKLCMIALRELQGSWPVSGWIFLLFAKIVRGIRDDDDPKSDRKDSNQTHPQAPCVLPDLENGGNDSIPRLSAAVQPIQAAFLQSHWQPWSMTDSGVTGYNTPNSTLREPAPVMDFRQMPLDLSTDWSCVRDQDQWLVPGFDFLGSMPGPNDFGGFSGA